jgi:hypothetical protein
MEASLPGLFSENTEICLMIKSFSSIIISSCPVPARQRQPRLH